MQTDTIGAQTALCDETQFVTFLLQQEEYGFDIMSVQEIIRVPQLARVPKTPDYVEGIANLRGSVLPIIDMRKRFGIESASDTDRTRVLVIDVDGAKTGVRVDGVRQVTRVNRKEIEQPPPAIRSSSADYLHGVVKLDGGQRIIMALDASRVCTHSGENTNGPGASARSATSSLSGSRESHEQTDIKQLVTFRIAREEFAFPMENVREILRVTKPKQVPDAPEYILGVLTVRGQILPILDLRKLLGQPTLSADLITQCDELASHYEGWKSGTAVPEEMRAWGASFTTSSELLSEAAARLRAANERVLKSLQDGTDPSAAKAETLGRLRDLQVAIGANVADDQRIVVVDANGHPLGLVVDHVNEVMNVPRNLIDAPPEMLRAGTLELAGITRLDNGSRLIMLLDVTRLIEGDALKRIAEEDAAQHSETATQAMAKTEGDDMQLVTFALGTEEFGIPISQVQEIDRVSRITRIPNAPVFVEGITNLRGEVVPVIDTRKRFGMEPRAVDDRTRIMIVELAGVKTGIVVDSVREVLTMPARSITPPPASLSGGVDQQFISGIGRIDDGRRMVILLDVEKILSQREHQDLAAFSNEH